MITTVLAPLLLRRAYDKDPPEEANNQQKKIQTHPTTYQPTHFNLSHFIINIDHKQPHINLNKNLQNTNNG